MYTQRELDSSLDSESMLTTVADEDYVEEEEVEGASGEYHIIPTSSLLRKGKGDSSSHTHYSIDHRRSERWLIQQQLREGGMVLRIYEHHKDATYGFLLEVFLPFDEMLTPELVRYTRTLGTLETGSGTHIQMEHP